MVRQNTPKKMNAILNFITNKMCGKSPQHNSSNVNNPCTLESLEDRNLYSVAGLTNHWNFDEGPDWHDAAYQSQSQITVAADSVSGNNATMTNMTATDWISGRQNTALDFDGTNDYLATASSLAGTLGGTSSLSFWIKTTQVGNNTHWQAPGVTGVEQAGGANDIFWGWLDGSGKIGLQAGSGAAAKSTNAVNDDKWHHIVLTRDATSGLQQIYVDGTLNSSVTGETGIKTAPFSSLGRIEDTGGTPTYLDGRLDQIHVFNTVIDASMVAQLKDNHAPKGADVTTEVGGTVATDTDSVLFQAFDPEQDNLSVVSHTNPTNGSIVNNNNGTFKYTANANFTGNDSFKVVIEDNKGGFDTVTVNLNVVAATQGAWTGTFTNFQAIQAGGSNIALSGMRVPRAVDWDVDGDNDLLVGHGGAVWRYTNTGTTTAPVFGAGVKVQANGSDIALSGNMVITLVDMTGDGVKDLVAVDSGSKKIRVYQNTAAANQTPVYAAPTIIQASAGGDFVLHDERTDFADVNNDGKIDVITGARSGEMRVYLNQGTTSTAQYNTTYTTLDSGSYNLFPRAVDLNNDGKLDFIKTVNWGNMNVYNSPDFSKALGTSVGDLVIKDSLGATIDIRAQTDGAIFEFADFNGDGIKDILVGGHAGAQTSIAYGQNRSTSIIISDIEAIYDDPANQANLGNALEANSQALLNKLKGYHSEIILQANMSLPAAKITSYNQLKTHVLKYSFLKMDTIIDTTKFHHLPGTAAQYLVTMHQLLPDTPAHRTDVADTFSLVGKKRDIFLDFSIFVGDNQNSTAGTMQAYYDIISRQSRISFPDTAITKDHFMGDGDGAFVNAFTSRKNTFNTEAGQNSTEMPTEHRDVIRNFTGEDLFNGDYGMAVLGHEMHHSMDNYVRTRANEDLTRRWGQMIVHGGGPDIRADANGWYSQSLTQAHWETAGLYTPANETWTVAWDRYWSTGAGAAFNKLSSYKNDSNFRLVTSQETLAGLANFNFDYAEGNLLLAVDRFRRANAGGASLAPLKATINDAVHFIDFRSTGQNKVIMYDTRGTGSGTDWSASTYAYLERDDNGYITKITIEDRIYEFTYDATGIINNIIAAPQRANDDTVTTSGGTAVAINPLANDIDLLGNNPITINSFTQAANGTVTQNGNTFTYTPNANFSGVDTFTYTTDITTGNATATVKVLVDLPDHLWKLDDGAGITATDSSGNANGTLVNMDPATDWVTGHTGSNALDFDGTNDKITFGTGPSLSGQTNFTISAWVKTTSTASGTIIQQRDGGFNGQYWLRTNANGTVNFALYGDNAYQFNFSTTATVNDGNWHHVAVQRDGADGKIFIDGAQSATASGTIRNLSSSIGVAIGADIRDNNNFFNGTIDEVGIYKNALSAAKIASLAGGSSNTNPVANNDTASTNQNTAVAINNVLTNDTDADGDTLSVTSNTNASNGTVVRNGNSFTYTPNTNYTGIDTFTYTISDGNGGTSTGTVNVTVNAVSSTQTFANTTDVSISASGTPTVTSDIVVSGMTGTVSDINIKMNIDHTYLADLDVTLIAPDGTRFVLFTDIGGSANNLVNTVIDDQATTAIGASGTSAPYTGSFKPESGLLSSLNGKIANGTWRLEIKDDANQDGGILKDWEITITTS